ncbi:hybrid sensor histidine kinase/response regulator transcription factor [Aquimarina intermedia]|uniref:histidine kinase n=1 Tax=Aquimarina intermedia TaxID=350814 RepID=A0A5S5CDA6_9FLAO|nr:substrate-binding domain-containing protein [Aquimarina intermedia]TYP77317.1 monosaccharide ABC transporter substrate-binding protein (CUT2 family) [Aquimarina intermedia]
MFRLIMFVFIGLNLFSCSNQKENSKFKIGFSQTGFEDDWRKAMNQSMEIQAGFYPEIKLIILDGEDDIDNQIGDIKKLIDSRVDALIVSPVKSKPITPIVEKAFKMGIPVLVVDRKIDGQNYTAYLGGDNYRVGANAANYLASISQSKKRIIEIKGLSGSSPALERSLGFNNVIKNTENLEVVKTLESNWESYSIKDSLRLLLDEIKEIDYIFTHNDRMALGAWEVAKEKGLHNSIKFIGVDGLPGPNGGINLVQQEILLATILYPTGGDEAIKIALKILNGEKVPKNNILNTTLIDSRNADIMKNQFEKIAQHQMDIENQQKKIKKQEETYSTQLNNLKLLLALLILSFLLGTYGIYTSYKLKKKKRELELQNKKITVQRNQIKKIAEEVKRSNEAKTNFFTGLSHEFKTPITLILSSIESLSENKLLDKKLTREVGLMFNNSKRLLRLINQLLDFRKIEDRKFILKASETNLYEFSKLIFNDFKREAQKRNINFSFTCNNKELKIFIDRDLMDKVYFNLLSNAFKFTPHNGTIHIEIHDDKESNFANICFKDSGIGIPKEEINKVFKPFYQGSNNNKSSSGIGLHLSKEFVELHKGSIEVRSRHGAEFIISLYKGSAHLNSDEVIFEPDIIDDGVLTFSEDYEEDTFKISKKINSEEKYSILIIEDNSDLAQYLKGKLSTEYQICISDGSDGVEKSLELIPDIIISDINLSGKLSGFEICKTLKNDLRTSHIPNIILTALNNKESYIQGLQSGADLYLTKPFSFAILFQSIKTLLYNREKLRYYYINNIHKVDTHHNFGLFEQDFISSINRFIEENLDNSSFSVEQLADKLNISRVQLYRKIKAILGINISDYIHNIRLDRARAMLDDSKLSISEIAYAVGFSSPNYFSTSFKNKFNKTPKAYRTNKD